MNSARTQKRNNSRKRKQVNKDKVDKIKKDKDKIYAALDSGKTMNVDEINDQLFEGKYTKDHIESMIINININNNYNMKICINGESSYYITQSEFNYTADCL